MSDVNEHSVCNPLLSGDSIVRKNLMTRRGYAPYCGADVCSKGTPRTTFDGKQFFCNCGWRSEFPDDFIRKYLEHWAAVEQRYVDSANMDFERFKQGLM